MSVSTDGIIGFGVIITGNLPWYDDDDEYEGDYEEWWKDETGFGLKWSDGNSDEYFKLSKEHMKAHPLPFEEINYCSVDYPEYVLAVPSSVVRCVRGLPTKIDKLSFEKKEVTALLEFLEKYEIEYEGDIGWYLMSYWG